MKDDKTQPGARGPQGRTTPVQGETQKPQPREPYERDQSSDSQSADASSIKRMGEIAHDDVAEGQVDTGKGPALDDTYERLREGEPKKRPN